MLLSSTRVAIISLTVAIAAPAAAQHRGGGGPAGAAPSAPAARSAPSMSAPRAVPQMLAPRSAPQMPAPRYSAPQRSVEPRGVPSQAEREAPARRISPPAPERRQVERPQIERRQTETRRPETPRESINPARPPSDSTIGQGRPRGPNQQNIARPSEGPGQQQPSVGARAPAREAATVPGIRAGQNVPPQARSALLQRAARGAGVVAGGVLLNQAFANRAPRNPADRALAFSTFRGRFGALPPAWHRRHHRAVVIGWIGPLFWPYAYADVVDYAFYPHSYDTFWPYAYDDVYQGIFGSYAYGYDEGDATVGRAPRAIDKAYAYAGGPAGRTALCTTEAATLTNWPIDRIVQTVGPDDSQRVALNALRDATAQALDILRNACPTTLPSTPTARLTAMRERLEAMLQAVRTIRPALEDFYGLLDDEQKARFNAMEDEGNQDPAQARRDLTQVCNENAAGIGRIPLERIESSLQITGAQRDAFEALQDASSQAADNLKASCPEFRTMTPTGRVAAMEQRLDSMLQAVKLVEPALTKFYNVLNDEQKERFNRLAPAQG